MEDAKDYYKRHGPMTTAGPFHSELQVFPKSVAELCRVIQGNLIHRDLTAWLYDLKLSPEEILRRAFKPGSQPQHLQLHLVAVLGLHKNDRLEKPEDELQQPGSPSYHRFITLAEKPWTDGLASFVRSYPSIETAPGFPGFYFAA